MGAHVGLGSSGPDGPDWCPAEQLGVLLVAAQLEDRHLKAETGHGAWAQARRVRHNTL